PARWRRCRRCGCCIPCRPGWTTCWPRPLVEADLQAALADGRLRGALVDVYAQEPLPPQHPLWRCPSLVITPHMASVAPFERVAGQILENLRRLNAGEALMNLVDPRRGY
ncbi:NAD(P)-dependent oxidoreductase, partial [Bordetella pertussis]|uniref:NAD(P)-dependent oxidoreductase n=1 Tax=Bordetella pertussis TaxID=520 RepID=UPI00291682AA